MTLEVAAPGLQRQGDPPVLRTSTLAIYSSPGSLTTWPVSDQPLLWRQDGTSVAVLRWPQAFIHTCRSPSVLWAGGAHQWPACAPHSSGSPDGTEFAGTALWREDCQRQTHLGEVTTGLRKSTSWLLICHQPGNYFLLSGSPCPAGLLVYIADIHQFLSLCLHSCFYCNRV